MKPFQTRFQTQTKGLLAVCLLGGLFLACGPIDPGGDLALKIHYNAANTVDRTRTSDPPPSGQAPDDITAYRICVSAADMDKRKCKEFNRQDNASGAKLGGLPPGSDRLVTFQGYDEDNGFEVRWCGSVSGVRVQTDKTTPISMYITACSNFTAVRNTMQHQRVFHTSTLLPDGRVLIAGGFSSVTGPDSCSGGPCFTLSATRSVDFYDPRTGQFESSSGLELTQARGLHTASLLPDGRVLIAGGAGKAVWQTGFSSGPRPVVEVDTRLGGDDSLAGASADLVDPIARTTTEIRLTTSRADHRAVSFSDGGVLLMQGINPSTNVSLDSLSRYDVTSQAFEDLPDPLRAPRQAVALASFADHTFLLWGGNHADTGSPGEFAEVIFEQEDGSPYGFSPAFVMGPQGYQGDPAFYAAAASPGRNQVVVCGGMIVDNDYEPALTNRVRIMDSFRVLDMTPQGEAFLALPDGRMVLPRAFHSATALASSPVSGEVMVAGGASFYNAGGSSFTLTNEVEFFSQADMDFAVKQINGISVNLMEPRAGHAVSVLTDGTVLLSGGLTAQPGLAISISAEIYNPAPRTLRAE